MSYTADLSLEVKRSQLSVLLKIFSKKTVDKLKLKTTTTDREVAQGLGTVGTVLENNNQPSAFFTSIYCFGFKIHTVVTGHFTLDWKEQKLKVCFSLF